MCIHIVKLMMTRIELYISRTEQAGTEVVSSVTFWRSYRSSVLGNESCYWIYLFLSKIHRNLSKLTATSNFSVLVSNFRHFPKASSGKGRIFSVIPTEIHRILFQESSFCAREIYITNDLLLENADFCCLDASPIHAQMFSLQAE